MNAKRIESFLRISSLCLSITSGSYPGLRDTVLTSVMSSLERLVRLPRILRPRFQGLEMGAGVTKLDIASEKGKDGGLGDSQTGGSERGERLGSSGRLPTTS